MALMSTTAALLCCILWVAVQCQTNICYERADILFVMDSSSSVGPENFQQQLQFAATFVNSFQVGVTQFSVIRFGTTPSVVINFGDYNDNRILKNAILNIDYEEGGTDTAAALRLAREQAFTSSGARKGVPKIVIVSTDGQSNNPNETAVEAARLKSSNVLVLSIGIGGAYVRAELDAIATFPEDVFEVPDYSQLVSIVQTYSQMVCEEVKQFDCNNQADIFFLLDASSNIPPTSFDREINFVSNVSFNFDLLNVRIGAGTFGGGSFLQLITLGQFNNQFNLAQVLLAATQLNGVTDTDSALKSVQSQKLFDTSSGGRPDAAKVLVILTDGGSVSASQARLTATQLRLTGVKIVSVGVSNPNMAELLDLVGNSVLDVVANLASPNVLASRVLSLTASQECSVPGSGSRNVSEYCRKNLLVNGIHPHPHDCTKFIECTFLRTSIMPCGPNLVYDPIIQTCTYPGLAAPCYGDPATIRTPPPAHVTQPTTSAKPCVKGLVDILYIFDSSDNIGSDYFFSLELAVAANIAENFHLGADGVQYGALSFGATTHHLFNFNQFTEYKILQEAILSANYLGGATNTDLALSNAKDVFSSGHGAREGSPKLAIVFSNGRSANSARTLQEATALKAAGVHVISVGISNADLPELQAIASSPSEVFPYNNFNGILNALDAYINTTCQTDRGRCHGIQFSDVVFILDSSASISTPDYRGQLNFVVDITSKFTLGPDDIQFGAVIFSTDPVKLFDLKDFNSLSALNSAVLSAAHLNSGTDTAKAINFVREQQMFSKFAGGRDNATKVVVILTDGRSNSINDTVLAAQRLKSTGVKFIVIGIGSEVYEEELNQLASDVDSIFLVPGFDALKQLNSSVSRQICNVKDPVVVPVDSILCFQYSWADGRHPNPNDCSKYVECGSLVTILYACNSGDAYDPIKGLCTDRALAHPCNDPLYFGDTVTTVSVGVATTKGPTITNINNLCKDFALADGNYPDPSQCERFVECTAQLTRNETCPYGLHFNTGNSVCDDVHAVDCQINYHYFDRR
jgi:Mg-chelatase subunit ChlD